MTGIRSLISGAPILLILQADDWQDITSLCLDAMQAFDRKAA